MAGQTDSAGAHREPAHAARPKSIESERLPLESADRTLLDATVDKALDYLANHQSSDGSFETAGLARPAVTSLCVMAFLSRGHQPGTGKYGGNIERAIDYVLQFQDPESGAIFPASALNAGGIASRSANYTHGICSTMLADVFPMTGRLQYARATAETEAAVLDRRRHDQIERAVRKSIAYVRKEQSKAKAVFGEQGGWRYVESNFRNESDLSVTAWMIMFLHSARKSGFKVPDSMIKGGLRFVHRAYNKKRHGFVYVLSESHRHATRATVGGGILCLLLGGEAVGPQVKDAAAWILKQPFQPYNRSWPPGDRYHYSAFYCSQAMGLLGGSYFREFYPNLLHVLAENQHSDGSWDPESFSSDTVFGEVYSTALAVLALSPPYERLQTYLR